MNFETKDFFPCMKFVARNNSWNMDKHFIYILGIASEDLWINIHHEGLRNRIARNGELMPYWEKWWQGDIGTGQGIIAGFNDEANFLFPISGKKINFPVRWSTALCRRHASQGLFICGVVCFFIYKFLLLSNCECSMGFSTSLER